MKNWTLAEAKKDFERGLLKSLRFVRQPLSERWSIQIISTLALDGEGFILAAHGRHVREFKDLDAAVRTAGDIGFKTDVIRL